MLRRIQPCRQYGSLLLLSNEWVTIHMLGVRNARRFLSINVATMPRPWADQPYSLINTKPFSQDVGVPAFLPRLDAHRTTGPYSHLTRPTV